MNNKTAILITILIIVFSSIALTLWKVSNRHLERTVLVVQKRIIESALDCFNDDVCLNDKVTLGELIKKGYLSKEINPVTKTYYSNESYVTKKELTFVEI